MTLEQDADFKITATWEDNASGPIIQSTEKINLAWKKMRNEQRAVQRQFEINNRTMVATGRVISTVTGVVSRGIQVFQAYTLMQIRAQDSTRNLREAQKSLDETLAEFGPNSKEYMDALEDVEQAEKDLADTTRDNLVGSILSGVLILGTFSSAITRLIPRIAKLKLSMKSIPTPKSPVPTPKPTGTTGTIGKTLGKLGKVGAGVGGAAAGAGLFLAQLMGEQNASAPLADAQGNPLEDQGRTVSDNGLDNLGQVVKDITVHINNFINAPTSDQMNSEITEATKRGFTFGS